MYYHHFITSVFENVDESVELDLMISSQMHKNNQGIPRSLQF